MLLNAARLACWKAGSPDVEVMNTSLVCVQLFIQLTVIGIYTDMYIVQYCREVKPAGGETVNLLVVADPSGGVRTP